MATYQYIAKDAEGNEFRGEVEAGSRNEAIDAVRAQGIFPTALGEVRSTAPAAEPAARQKSQGRAAPRGAGGGAPGRKPAFSPPPKKGTGLNREIHINIQLPTWLQP